jgi:hypothetical protein
MEVSFPPSVSIAQTLWLQVSFFLSVSIAQVTLIPVNLRFIVSLSESNDFCASWNVTVHELFNVFYA